MIYRVVISIRAATALSFDFLLLVGFASILATFSLLEIPAAIVVASMLANPLMNSIIGIISGLFVREHSLWRRGVCNEWIDLLSCIILELRPVCICHLRRNGVSWKHC